MFERYTEKARRVIFFARYEASAFGSMAIESEHLLLGLVRENQANLNGYLKRATSQDEIRAVLVKTLPSRPRTATSIDLPLSEESKRILGFGAEEAELLGHEYIGAEHLMLGILREKNCLAAKLLRERGLQLDRARTLVAATEREGATRREAGISSVNAVSRQPRTTVEFREAAGSEPLLTHGDVALIPRIGETVRIWHAEDNYQSYRVENVTWQLSQNAEMPSWTAVVVNVECKPVADSDPRESA